MKKLFAFFKPAPHVKEIEDPAEVKSKYSYWRWRTFYGMYIGYALYYFSRKSLVVSMPLLTEDLGFTKGDLGILLTLLSFFYGVSKFLSGVLSDRSNPRIFMAFGLIATGVLNIFFGMSSSLLFFALFWALNGYFQGFGWPPCARLLTHWYSQKERGTWWGFWNSSHSVGGALIVLLVGFCAKYWGWRVGMYVPGALCIAGGLFLLNRLRDTPRSLGLPAIEKFKNDYPKEHKEEENDLTAKEILFKHVLNNKMIWLLGIAYFFVYIIRMAINDWSTIYLVETRGYNVLAAGACVFWFEIGGIFGSLVAGWASDKVFKGRRGPISILFSFGVIFALLAFWNAPAGLPLLDSALMFGIGFLIFGPQMLVGMIPAELAGKKAAGAATGFVGFIAYIGASVAGYPIGLICQRWGWEGFFITLGLGGILSVLLLAPVWKVGEGQQVAEKSSLDDEDDANKTIEVEPSS